MNIQYCSILQSPLGPISIVADEQFVQKISFKEHIITEQNENEITQLAVSQLTAYFEGSLKTFTLPIQQPGTAFQQEVWAALLTIDYGVTRSYLQMAKQMNNVLAIRAMAAANGKNNLAIVVPCHRVIGSDGTLVGYAGSLWRKKWLLDHEREVSQQGQMMLKF
ncbi:methylated-DNA-[protein]-cysteine S-methyltransferase [Pedobacter steynii]|uniref:Methylated-DNA--protein-cysteine methyltransferase n=1 Tax=Pedobacter steynii TaxID=430522 RepID=A0A1G9YV81_9SPHI|nr:methylated-DNA--[protein]-cysteine S-methyltransferase [Pedobacter steynii]NQX39832.1 methylated-DNA--[protein]-cysteine S-methyltransferase [Pedobacter steynii]SDN12555.1 methylated-DNA-[protein]-cysteine S-methyltransferase [Pedobacter steynii]